MEVECQYKICWTVYLPTNQLHHSVTTRITTTKQIAISTAEHN